MGLESHDSHELGTVGPNGNPALILFCFLPALLWNTFTEYVRSQRISSSPALDVALHKVGTLCFQRKLMKDYSYTYRTSNWDRASLKRESIRKYMLSDGWGIFTSEIHAEFISKVDQFVFVQYFGRKNFQSKSSVFYENAFSAMLPSKLHFARISLNLSFYKMIHNNLRYAPFLHRLITSSATLKSKLIFLECIKNVYSSESSHEAAKHLSRLGELESIVAVHSRINFWVNQLLSADNIKLSGSTKR
jgi:hypothetical protein